jgi:hypothetical protein
MKKPYAVVRSRRELAFQERKDAWAAACALNPALASKRIRPDGHGGARRLLRDVLRRIPKAIRRHDGAGSMVPS